MTALATLSPRERALLLVALPLALGAAGYLLAWQPLQGARAAREAAIAGYRLVAEAAADAGRSPAPAAPGSPEPLAARVTRSAEAAGLSLTRLEPEGEGLRVTVAEAGFAPLVLWIADREAARDATLAAIEVDRRPAPGVVGARLLLAPAP